MSGETSREYSIPLSEEDELLISNTRRSRKPLKAELKKFSLVYRTRVAGRWRVVRRYDNCHGFPHKHVFNWGGEVAGISRVPLGDYEDSATVFTLALKEMKKDYGKIKKWYLESRSKYE